MTYRPQVGDRIEVTGTMVDPAPLEIGARGTVTEVCNQGTPAEQVRVAWDAGRGLLLIPEDYSIVRKIEEEK